MAFTIDASGPFPRPLRRPKHIVLKDGREVLIEVSAIQRETYLAVQVSARVDDFEIGWATFAENDGVPDWDSDALGSWSSLITSVDPDWRRVGVATALYDAAARLGLKIIPSGQYGGKLSEDARSLWNSRIVWKRRAGNSLKTPYYPRTWRARPAKRAAR